jgi:hypothetical protein
LGFGIGQHHPGCPHQDLGMFEFNSLRVECSTELAASSRGIVALRFDHVDVVGGGRPRGSELACELLQCAPVAPKERAGDQWMLGRATG